MTATKSAKRRSQERKLRNSRRRQRQILESTTSINLFERSQDNADIRIDEDAGVIHGVKILGSRSDNGRRYTDDAMNDAVRLYENQDVMIDHPDKRDPGVERGLLEGFGQLRNVRRQGDSVYGDLHYLKNHPLSAVVIERARKFPRNFGLSHNAHGSVRREDGEQVVESIEFVRSVDIVLRPATNKGLFESKEDEMKVRTIRQILESIRDKKVKKSPAYVSLLEMADEEMAVGGEPVAEMEVEVAPEDSAEDQIKNAFRSMVMAAFDDDSLDTKATMAKIKEILDSQTKLLGAPAAESEEEKSEEEVSEQEEETKGEEMAESKPNKQIATLVESINDLKGEIKSLKEEQHKTTVNDHCRSLLESANREVTDERIGFLSALDSDKQRKSLIESWAEADDYEDHDYGRRSRRPSVSQPINESQGEFEAKTAEDFANRLLNA